MRPILALLTLLSCLVAGPVFAQDAGKAFSTEEKAKIQEQLRGIAAAMGVNEETRQAPTEGSKEHPKQKTAAEVADRALDMFGGLVTSIAGTMSKAAPKVWRIMIRQQYAKALADLLTPWGIVLLAFCYCRITRKLLPQTEEHITTEERTDRFIITDVLSIVCGVIATICGIVALSNSIKFLINPEYYAVRDILIMLINPSQATM